MLLLRLLSVRAGEALVDELASSPSGFFFFLPRFFGGAPPPAVGFVAVALASFDEFN
jgi:hypothetical protein